MHLASALSGAILFSSLCLAGGAVFDTASLKMSVPDSSRGGPTGGPGTSDPGQFHNSRLQILDLLTMAFGLDLVNMDQIVGPAWIRHFSANEFYDIAVTMPASTTKEQFRKMLQNLLIERFQLMAHHETRNFPAWNLVLDQGGPKFREVAPDPNPSTGDQAFMMAGTGPDGFPAVRGPQIIRTGFSGPGQARLKYQEQAMVDFAADLGYNIGSSQGRSLREGFPQPRVFDKTGLTGKYTFILEYYDAGRVSAAPGRTILDVAPVGGFPNIFVAVQKQLGLRLDQAADVPVDVIVIDSLNRTLRRN